MKLAHQQFAEKLVQLLMWEATNNGFTPADLADQVGGSARTYENYKYGATPTIVGFFGILRTIKPRQVAKRIAEQCGGYFIPLSSNKASSLATLSKDTANIMKETADVINAVAKSLGDGKITPSEANYITHEIDEAIEALLCARIGLKERT